MPRSIHEKAQRRNKLELIKDLDKNIKRMGGLGSPHVGSPEWENKMAQYKKMKDFGNAYNLVNKYGNVRADIVSQHKQETSSIGRMDTLTWQELHVANSSSDVRSISNSRESVQAHHLKDPKALQNGSALPKPLVGSRIHVNRHPSLLTLD